MCAVEDEPAPSATSEIAPGPADGAIADFDPATVAMPTPPGKERGRSKSRSRGPKLDQVPDPNQLRAEAAERGLRDLLTEAEVARAFYWLYYLWCRLLGAKVEARYSDFNKIGKAWLELARKVPGAKVLIAILGPVVTMSDLFEKLERAWSARKRWRERPSWVSRRQRPEVVPMPEQHGSGGQ